MSDGCMGVEDHDLEWTDAGICKIMQIPHALVHEYQIASKCGLPLQLRVTTICSNSLLHEGSCRIAIASFDGNLRVHAIRRQNSVTRF